MQKQYLQNICNLKIGMKYDLVIKYTFNKNLNINSQS